MDSEDSQTNFHENRRMKMDAVKIVNKINKEHGTIKNVYFLACGGSLVDLYPGYYFVRAESAVMDAQWIPAREFALTPPKKLGKDSLSWGGEALGVAKPVSPPHTPPLRARRCATPWSVLIYRLSPVCCCIGSVRLSRFLFRRTGKRPAQRACSLLLMGAGLCQ